MMTEDDKIDLTMVKKELVATEDAITRIEKILAMLYDVADIQMIYGRATLTNCAMNLGGEKEFLEIRSYSLRRIMDELRGDAGSLIDPILNGDKP